MDKQKVIDGIKAEMKKISNSRDNLRTLVDEAKEIFDDADTAIMELESAADALSRNL